MIKIVLFILFYANQAMAGFFVPEHIEAKHVAEITYLELLKLELSDSIDFISFDSRQGKFLLNQWADTFISAEVISLQGDHYLCANNIMINKIEGKWTPREDYRNNPIYCRKKEQ